MEPKRIEFFNKLSFYTLLATIFVSLFFFIPFSPVTLEASKGFLLSIGTTLSIFFWLIARLGEGKFVFPKDRLILFAGAIPLVFLISSFFSPSLYISLFGSGFELGTFGSILILFIIFFLSAVSFHTEKHLWYFIGSIFLAGLVLAVFQIINLFIGFERIIPGIMQGVSAGNLVGSWNVFALLFGLLVILSLFTLEFLKSKGFFLVAQYFILVTGIIFLVMVNMPLAWLLVGIFSVIIFVYSLSLQHAGINVLHNNQDQKKFPFISLIVVFLFLVFFFGNNSLGGLISRYVNLSSQEVRPSFVTTTQIAWSSIKHNPFFGTGPNTFSLDWSLWKPRDVVQTVFWNTDFSNGYSTMSTFVATTGVLGLVAWLAFFYMLVMAGLKSLKVALKNPISNYFILTTLIISIYSWIVFILYTSNIVMMMLAFASSGILISILVFRQVIEVKSFSFLNKPRNSFFAILSLMVLLLLTLSVTYMYVEKFVSLMYFSKGLTTENTLEGLATSERMMVNAISLDKNDLYYRALSQVYVGQMNLLLNDKKGTEETLKATLQQLINASQRAATLAVGQNPKNYLNYTNLGNIYNSFVPLSVSGSYESALSAYGEAQKLAPNNPSILLSLAQLELTNKNNTKARELIQQALDLKLNYTDALFLLAQIEIGEGNNSGAIKQVEKAAEMNPTDPTIFFRLGLLRYNNSDYSGAVSAFEQAVILDNTYLNARYFLGLSYQKAGRKDDALVQFKILNEVVPNNQDVQNAINSVSSTSVIQTNEDKDATNKDTKEEAKKPVKKN
jgi:cytochrome c-type biogenesis protein CcmH/NrfG